MKTCEQMQKAFAEYNDLHSQVENKNVEVRNKMAEYCKERFVGKVIVDKFPNNPDYRPFRALIIHGVKSIADNMYKGDTTIRVEFYCTQLNFNEINSYDGFTGNYGCTKGYSDTCGLTVSFETGEMPYAREMPLQEISELYDIEHTDQAGNVYLLGDKVEVRSNDTLRFTSDMEDRIITGIVVERTDCYHIGIMDDDGNTHYAWPLKIRKIS